MKYIKYKSLNQGELECEVVLDENKVNLFLEELRNQGKNPYKALTTGELLIYKDFKENFIILNNAYKMGLLLPEIYERLKL